MSGDTTYTDFEEPPLCPKCKEGHLHFAFGGPTGYKAECDICDHSFPMKLGKKK